MKINLFSKLSFSVFNPFQIQIGHSVVQGKSLLWHVTAASQYTNIVGEEERSVAKSSECE